MNLFMFYTNNPWSTNLNVIIQSLITLNLQKFCNYHMVFQRLIDKYLLLIAKSGKSH